MGSEVYWIAVQCSDMKCREVKWSEVKWSEVIFLGEMFVLSLMYSYVTNVGFAQFVISLLFALCYFLITRLVFF